MIISKYDQYVFKEVFSRLSNAELNEIYELIYTCAKRGTESTRGIKFKDDNLIYTNYHHTVEDSLWEIEPHIKSSLKNIKIPYFNRDEVDVHVHIGYSVITFDIKSKWTYKHKELADFVNAVINDEKGKVHRWMPLKDSVQYLISRTLREHASMFQVYKIPENLMNKNHYCSLDIAMNHVLNEYLPNNDYVHVRIEFNSHFFVIKANHLCSQALTNKILANYNPNKEVSVKLGANDVAYILTHIAKELSLDNRETQKYLEVVANRICRDDLNGEYNVEVIFTETEKLINIFPKEIYMKRKVRKILLEIMGSLSINDIRSLYKNMHEIMNIPDCNTSISFDIDTNAKYEFYSKDYEVTDFNYWDIELMFGDITSGLELEDKHRKALDVRFTIKNDVITFYITHKKEDK